LSLDELLKDMSQWSEGSDEEEKKSL